MKRSRRVSVGMITLAALLVSLTGCTPDPTETISAFLGDLALQATAAFLL